MIIAINASSPVLKVAEINSNFFKCFGELLVTIDVFANFR